MSRMPVPSRDATRPKTMAQQNRAPVRWWKGGSPGMANENVPNPVSEFSPTKMSVPTPAANNPGTRTSSRSGPPIPAASISKKAPRIGEPKRVLMAAKLPAEAMTMAAAGGASRLASCTESSPNPPPMAISGASGPSTTPRLSVASAGDHHARKLVRAVGAPPPVLNPSAGMCPAVPGRYLMVAPTRTPARASNGSGHQTGVPAKPSAFGNDGRRSSPAAGRRV